MKRNPAKRSVFPNIALVVIGAIAVLTVIMGFLNNQLTGQLVKTQLQDQQDQGAAEQSGCRFIDEGDPIPEGFVLEEDESKCCPEDAECHTNADCDIYSNGDLEVVGTCTDCVCEPEYQNSFLAGTKINTPAGKRQVETLELGDEVLGYDHAKEEVVPTDIIYRFAYKVPDYYELELENGVVLEVTGTHPIFTGIDYVRVKDLEGTESFYEWSETKEELTPVPIKQISKVDEAAEVFNFHTSQGNYFAEGVLAHNKGEGACEKKTCSYCMPDIYCKVKWETATSQAMEKAGGAKSVYVLIYDDPLEIEEGWEYTPACPFFWGTTADCPDPEDFTAAEIAIASGLSADYCKKLCVKRWGVGDCGKARISGFIKDTAQFVFDPQVVEVRGLLVVKSEGGGAPKKVREEDPVDCDCNDEPEKVKPWSELPDNYWEGKKKPKCS